MLRVAAFDDVVKETETIIITARDDKALGMGCVIREKQILVLIKITVKCPRHNGFSRVKVDCVDEVQIQKIRGADNIVPWSGRYIDGSNLVPNNIMEDLSIILRENCLITNNIILSRNSVVVVLHVHALAIRIDHR